MSKLDRRRKGVYGPAMGKKCIILIDDLNLPQKDESGTIPPVELLRQWVDHGYWYDKKDRTKVSLNNEVHAVITSLLAHKCCKEELISTNSNCCNLYFLCAATNKDNGAQ